MTNTYKYKSSNEQMRHFPAPLILETVQEQAKPQSYIVYINNLNYVKSPFILDAERPIEVSETEYLKVQSFKSEYAWRWNEDLETFEEVVNPNLTALRFAREIECFKLVNRSQLWFNTLSPQQQTEVQEWYQAWLDVTETGQVPTKPEWLK